MEREGTAAVGGVSVVELLLVLFVGLKLAKIIDWSWWWVLAPAWSPVAFVALLLGFCLVVEGIDWARRRWRQWNLDRRRRRYLRGGRG